MADSTVPACSSACKYVHFCFTLTQQLVTLPPHDKHHEPASWRTRLQWLAAQDRQCTTTLLSRHTLVRQDTHVIDTGQMDTPLKIPPYDRRLHRQIHRLLPCSRQSQDPLLGGTQPELAHTAAAAGSKLHGYSTT